MRLIATLPDAQSTEALGRAVAEVLEASDVLLLFGGLGAGKTTLVRGLVHALCAEVEVTSPTFTLRHDYETTPPICHVDCWRLESPTELDELGLEEVLADGGALVIEWGELAERRFGDGALCVQLLDGADGASRVAQLFGASHAWDARLALVARALSALGLPLEVEAADGAER